MSSEIIIFNNMKEIVYNENRPFSYKDFLSFRLSGLYYSYKHGHIRNIFSTLRKKGLIEFVYRSPQAFYTINGVKFNNSLTPTYIMGTPSLNYKQKLHCKFLNIHNLKHPAIHDIRLCFTCKGLRPILLLSKNSIISNIDQKNNKDITLKDITLDDITLKITVHNTDTVTVMVACSDNPIPIDYMGLSKLSSALTRVEERLQRVVDDYTLNLNKDIEIGIEYDAIPYHMTWILAMRHYGYDSEVGFAGEMFEITWKEYLEVCHIYSKKSRTPKAYSSE